MARIEISKAKVNGKDAYFKDDVARESITDVKSIVESNTSEITTLKNRMPSNIVAKFENVSYFEVGFVYKDGAVYSANAYQYIGSEDFASLKESDLSPNSSDFSEVSVKFFFQPENNRVLMQANERITGFIWITSINN